MRRDSPRYPSFASFAFFAPERGEDFSSATNHRHQIEPRALADRQSSHGLNQAPASILEVLLQTFIMAKRAYV